MLQLSGHTSLRGQAAVLLLILSQNYRFLPEAKAQPGERGGFLLGPWEGQTNILRWRKGSEMSLPSPGPLLTKTCRCDQCLGDQGPPSIDRKSWGPERAVACPGSNSAEMAELGPGTSFLNYQSEAPTASSSSILCVSPAALQTLGWLGIGLLA